MKNLIYTIGILAFMLLGEVHTSAQELYRTRNSKIGFTGLYLGKPFHMYTQKAIIYLNYETAELTINVQLSSFYSPDHEVDSLLNLLADRPLSFEGKLGLDYINTKSHPLLEFEVRGILDLGQIQQPIHFNGRLLHLTEQGEVSCLLSLYPQIDLEEFQIPVANYGFYPIIQGQIDEAVLIKSNDN